MFEAIDQTQADNEKHFKQFYLNNSVITELEENTFYEITFDDITFDATKLSFINTHEFTATNFVTKLFRVNSGPLVNSPPNYDIFKILSLVKNIEEIDIYYTKIDEIPSNAFKPLMGIQNNLKILQFDCSNIKKLERMLFISLKI
jgi:hypothetical protein